MSTTPPTPRRSHWRSWLARVSLAVSAVALAQATEWSLGPKVTGVSPLFFVAVLLSAFFGGWQAGLIATLLSAICTAGIYFESPTPNDGIGADDAFRLAVFTAVALTVSWLQHINANATRDALAAGNEAHAAREMADAARRQAESANTAKDRFLNVLGHELRNPLNPVLAVVTMRLQGFDSEAHGAPDELLREDLEMIRRNVEVEARLIDDLLDSSRIRSGKLRLVRQGVNLLKLLGETVEAVRPAADAAGLSLEYRDPSPERLETAIIDGDPIRLRQVFWNLLNNAIKFTKAGGVVVTARPTVGRRGVVVSVGDSGSGVPRDLLGLIFEPFVQADRSDIYGTGRDASGDSGTVDAGGGGGLGLGLSIVRGFVTAHGGSIAVRSGVGRGSVFRVKLPAAWIDRRALADRDGPRDDAGPLMAGLMKDGGAATPYRDSDDFHSVAAGRAGHDLVGESDGPEHGEQVLLEERRPMRVLLVEDHPDTARVTARLLGREGHAVTVATSMAEALIAADRESFNLVVSDIGLGDGNGCDLMVRLRDEHGLCGIAVSGYATDADVRRSRASGFFVHLVKPVSLDTLCEQIQIVGEAIDGADGIGDFPPGRDDEEDGDAASFHDDSASSAAGASR